MRTAISTALAQVKDQVDHIQAKLRKSEQRLELVDIELYNLKVELANVEYLLTTFKDQEDQHLAITRPWTYPIS